MQKAGQAAEVDVVTGCRECPTEKRLLEEQKRLDQGRLACGVLPVEQGKRTQGKREGLPDTLEVVESKLGEKTSRGCGPNLVTNRWVRQVQLRCIALRFQFP